MAPRRKRTDDELYTEEDAELYRPSHARVDVDQQSVNRERNHSTQPRTSPANTLNPDLRPASLPPADSNYEAVNTPSQRIGTLTELSSDFVRIRLNDFRACDDFIDNEPDVLDEDVKALQREAQLAYGRREDGLGNRCVQRLLIIHKCRGLPRLAIQTFFDRLDRRGSTYQDFQKDYAKVTKNWRETAVPYDPPHEQAAQSAGLFRDQPLPKGPPVGHTYKEGYQTSTPIQIPSGRTKEYDRRTADSGAHRYMSPHDGRLGSVRDSPPASSSNPFADTYAPERSQVLSGQDIPVRSRPPYFPNASNSQPPRFSRSTIEPGTEDEILYDMHAANQPFVPGGNNPNRTPRRAPSQMESSLPTQSVRDDDGSSMFRTSTQPEPPQSLPPVEQSKNDSPPGNSKLRMRQQGTILEPTLLPSTALDIRGRHTETDDAQYSVRKDGNRFFKAGRVFKIMWHTPAGTNRQGQINSSSHISDGPLKSKIHSKVMLMLVVIQKHGYSICCPISTYDGNGLLYKKLAQQDIRAHAVVHSSSRRAITFHGEPKMGKDPVPVDMAEGQPDLHKASRVHFGKFHSVEWNVFVSNVGIVKKGYEEAVRNYFIRELLGPTPHA